MADSTFGVKVSEELKEKVQSMIAGSNLSSKEWFEKAMALVAVNELKDGVSDYKQDLNELEVHTTRIFELVANMVLRANHLKENETKQLIEKVDQKEMIISDYQGKLKESQVNIQTLEEQIKGSQELAEEVTRQLEESKLANVNHQELIKEYKEKIDSLSGLVAKYQGFASENEAMKEEFGLIKVQLQEQVDKLNKKAEEKEKALKEHEQLIQTLKETHSIEIERLLEKKGYEKDRALLELEKTFQTEMTKAVREHNQEIKSLYDNTDRVRKEYEEEIKSLQNKLSEKPEDGFN